jgi:hypothetical protein
MLNRGYGQLLGRVLPYHITGEVGKSIENKDAKLYTREYLEKLSLHEVTDLYRQQIAEHAGIVP